MRVLTACECSGVVREAFRERGHDAWSCDLLPAADRSPFHLRGDVSYAIRENNAFYFKSLERHMHWNMMVAHPPCDYLTNSAAWAFKDPDYNSYPGVGYHQKVKPGTLVGKERREAREKAVAFFLSLWRAPIAKIAIENPIGHMNTHPALPKTSPGRQIIQPWQFGDDASKATCLWLKGLSPLVADPAKAFPPRYVCQDCKFTFRNGWSGEDCPKCGYADIKPRWSNQTDSGQNRLSPSDDRASVRAVTYAGIAKAMAQQWG